MEPKTGCLICGKDLTYTKEDQSFECLYCRESFESNVSCEDGHYVCDRCHSIGANDLIEQFCISSDLKDPIAMAITLMKHPIIKMHGPEHHFLVPAVLIAAYSNIKGEQEEKEARVKKARRRAEKILGGFCGTHGNCGAGVGTGIFISIITEATPLSKEEWRLCNLMTARSLASVADMGGPRCCKRASFLSLLEAVKFIEENFGVNLGSEEQISCEFNNLNKECIGKRCTFNAGEDNE
jgi:hypothetical protein